MQQIPALSFSELITGKLEPFRDELAKACESREAQLRNQNDSLLAENALLRQQLGVQKAAVAETKDDADLRQVIYLGEENENDQTAQGSRILPSKDTQLQAATSRSANCEAFELLPDLMKTPIPLEDVLVGESGPRLNEFDVGLHFAATLSQEVSEGILTIGTGRCPVISPSSTKRIYWDLLGIPVLAWDLFTIPLGVFDQPLPDFEGWVPLLYWTIDIPLTFMTAFYDAEGKELRDRQTIALNYLRGMFLLDFLMVSADWIAIFIGLTTEREDGPSILRSLSMLRVLRLSRFVRLLRLQKFQDKMQVLEDCVQNEWYLHFLDLTTKVLKILAVNHYICCIWYAIGDASFLAEPEDRWLTTYTYTHNELLSTASFWNKYTTCLLWAVTMFTPGGLNIIPKNPYERIFNIVVLMFGLVIFSSFVAAVTQSRIAMAKMMGNFEHEHRALREYCRQEGISQSLRSEIKRYVANVLSPFKQKQVVNVREIGIVRKLSSHLQQQLHCEIFSQKVTTHPLFAHVLERYRPLMNNICTHVLESMPLAKQDIAFSGGQKAQFMMILGSGCCSYVLTKDPTAYTLVNNGKWASEAAFWTMWIHQGQLQAIRDTHAEYVDAVKFRAVVLGDAICMRTIRKYGLAFCESLNVLVRSKATLTDLHQFASSYFCGPVVL